MKKKHYVYPFALTLGLGLLAFTLSCRMSTRIADFYALAVYPPFSAFLSRLASCVPFSLQDVALLSIIGTAVGIIIVSIRQKWGLRRALKWEVLLLLCTFDWFYMAWCNNYYRSSIYSRTQIQLTAYDEREFRDFLNDFTARTNAEWTTERALPGTVLEEEIKAFYNRMPATFGLTEARSWQHPKPSIFNGFYSAVGVLGTMEPLFSESCINQDIQPFDYPFVYAHEYAHLLGISSEAECNWWAYHACLSSRHQAVRYSAMKNILPHVMHNAQSFLSEDEYKSWADGLRPEVIADLRYTSIHWNALRSPLLRKIHEVTYDLFLKGNHISSGRQNYSEVVGMLLSIKLQGIDSK